MDTPMGELNEQNRPTDSDLQPPPHLPPQQPTLWKQNKTSLPDRISAEGKVTLVGDSKALTTYPTSSPETIQTIPPSTQIRGNDRSSGSDTIPCTTSATEQPRLVFSDRDSHLIDLPNTPPIATGGFCELYLGVYRPKNLKLAMRRMRVGFPTDDMLRRFRREADIWSTFSHPNILPFLGTMSINHWIYMVSPWMSNGDLLSFVQSRIKSMEQKDLLPRETYTLYSRFNETRIIREIAAGLQHLHSINVIHGDMKAKNVLLTDGGCAQICDFGLTKVLHSDHAVTSTDLKGVGSIRWQSPELLNNDTKSPQSDVYAFGMTISEVLTGEYPFYRMKEQTAVLMAVMVRNERPATEPAGRRMVDFKPLWKVASRCWQTDPKERPVMKAVLNELDFLHRHPNGTSFGLSYSADIRGRMREVFAECHRVVTNISDGNRKRCELFKKLPSKRDYADYYHVIENPIAIDTIRKRSNTNHYKSVEQYAEDWRLLFNNARTYNQEGSWVYDDAEEMQRIFETTLYRLTAGTDLPGAPSATAAYDRQGEQPGLGGYLSDDSVESPRRQRKRKTKGGSDDDYEGDD